MMIELKQASGEVLDRIANMYGFERKIYFWIFKERDKSLRVRIISWIKNRNWYLK